MYFVCASKNIFEMALQCHVRNVLVSYFYLPKVGTPNWIKSNVDKLFVDSGAHSARTLGIEIDMYEYYDYLKKYSELIDVGAHFDIVDDIKKSKKNLEEAKRLGLDWLLPVLQGYWPKCLAQYKNVADDDYYGLGGIDMIRRRYGFPLVEAVRRMPRNKKYHGFGKVNFELFKKGLLYSADSSSWVTVARYGVTMAYDKFGVNQDGFSVMNHGKDKLDIVRYFEMHKDDCEACGVTKAGVMSGDYRYTTKFMIAVFYRPILRKLGMFDENFYE